jgi:hypothetical protein
MVNKGDGENLRGLKNGQKSLSMCVFWVHLYVNVDGLHFMRKYPDYLELRRIAIVH